MNARLDTEPLRVECAVVLAAGAGQRLRASASQPDLGPKPLVPVLGTPLIVRSLCHLQNRGVREAVVVTGHAREEVERALRADSRLAGMALRFPHNSEWRLQNGISVLAAREAVADRPFFLAMGDHLYEPRLLEVLLRSWSASAGLTLAVDRKLGQVSDLADAVKVRTEGSRILDLGKRQEPFDAVDTGVFLAANALFEALAECRARQEGDCSLVDGVRALARLGRAHAADIGAAWWQDVDDAASLGLAERHLRELESRRATV